MEFKNSSKSIKITVITFFLTIFLINVNAQCLPNQAQLEINIVADNFPNESSWLLFVDNVQVANGTTNNATLCLDTNACIRFEMHDSYGDGICCNYGQGSYTVSWDGNIVVQGGQFTTIASHTFNCPLGTACENPIPISTGTFLAPNPNTFYSFTPDSTGMYSITTCNLTTCDTKLWVYGGCNNYVNNTNNTGTLFYNDDNALCGLRADIDAILTAGVTYIIKVGLYGTVTCNGGIPFSVIYDGPVTGCMDPQACNFNPDATVSGQCFYYPDPNCPGGPDLMIVQSAVENSLEIREEFATNCMVAEGCMNGYGNRTVLAFDTHIKNVGDMDYYIGNPANNPDQFSLQNCHGHAHYEGYADYVLYTMDGQYIPIGHKNGFCVLDLECSDGGTAQYGCGNMGISHQCGDIYNRSLDCQWIDITDLDTADYILAIKVNWDQSPDALGHYESSYDNNWAQVCIRISETNGVKSFTLLPNCSPYYDCAGVMYGNSQLDCNGNCNGGAKRGDLDLNGLANNTDVDLYMNHAVQNDLVPTSCNDLSGDGIIDVWDAGLLMNCLQNGAPNNAECIFPNSVVNTQETVFIGEVEVYTDFANSSIGFMDVKIKNPMNEVKGYEFNISGADITGVSSLISANEFPANVYFDDLTKEVAAISIVDSFIPKYTSFTPFVRVYLSNLTNEICLDSVIRVLNKQVEPVNIQLSNGCLTSQSGITEISELSDIQIFPNPTTGLLNLKIPNIKDEITVSIFDIDERCVYRNNYVNQQDVLLKMDYFKPGTYIVKVKSDKSEFHSRVVNL